MVSPDVSSGGRAFCRLTQRAGGGRGASEAVGLRQDGAVVGADSMISSPKIPFFLAALGLLGCLAFLQVGGWALLTVAAPLVERRLWCPGARGVFPDQGLNPCLLRWPSAEVL